jgi:hypothetical protein
MNKLVTALPLVLTFGCTTRVILGFEDGGTSGGASMTNGAASSTGAGTTSGTTGGQNTGTGSTGGTSAGNTTGNATGSSTGTTGANLCLGIYCAPSFACDPSNGTCECAGQACSGNCDADSGACLIACDAVDGGTYPLVGQSPYAVQMTTATVGRTYSYTLQPACVGVPPVTWTFLSRNTEALANIGLAFYPAQGEILGVPTVASGAAPFEFEFEPEDQAFNTGVQNYLLEVLP